METKTDTPFAANNLEVDAHTSSETQWGVRWVDTENGTNDDWWYTTESSARHIHRTTRGDALLIRRVVTTISVQVIQ